MNATLQNLSNIPKLRENLLKFYEVIYTDRNKKKMTFALNEVFKNLWENPYIHSYSPNNFKLTLNSMNYPIEYNFKGNPKDLLLFILESIHKELNLVKNEEENITKVNNQDYESVFKLFVTKFTNNYNSLISNLFYGFYNSIMTCSNCGISIHNVRYFNTLAFHLEEVRNFKCYSFNSIRIIDCFDYFERKELLNFPSQLSCNNCNIFENGFRQDKIIICPKVLIINLDREKRIENNISIIFGEFLDLKRYTFYEQSPYLFELVDIISQ